MRKWPPCREQALDYLSGQVTSRLFRGAGTAIGLDTVTIEPATGAAEEDLSARLTVGKDITRDFSVIYSQNLAGPGDQSWILNYAALKNFVVRGISRPDEDEVRVEFRHGLEFGGGPPLPRRVTPRSEPVLGDLTFSRPRFPRRNCRNMWQDRPAVQRQPHGRRRSCSSRVLRFRRVCRCEDPNHPQRFWKPG